MQTFFAPIKTRFCYPLLFLILSYVLLFLSPIAYAAPRSCWACNWSPVLAVGAGYLSTSKLAQSQSFPIVNPITDEFFNYTPNQSSLTNGIADIFLGIEWRLGSCDQWALQLGLGYDQAASFTVKGSLVQGADVPSEDTFSYQYNVTLRQLLVEGKFLFTVATWYHPYLFGGIGAAFNSASGFSTTVPPFLTFTRNYASNTNTVFSYAVGFGLDYDIDAVFRIGVGYRFSDFGKVSLGSATIDTTSVSGTLSQSHIYTNEVLAQITCNFS